MLMTIILVLGIAAVGLHLFVAYIVPMFNPDRTAVALLCGIVAVIAIVLAFLVGFHVIVIPSGG